MINIAIVGVGNISNAHCAAYLAFPERCRITHLVDIIPERAERRNADLHLNAQIHSTHKEILDAADVDLVSICTPPYVHAEIAIDFLNAGKNVIVEKPMAASLEECDAMIEVAKRSGKTLSPIAQNRFLDPIMNLKRVLDSGEIGKIVHAQIDSFWWRGHSYYDLWWRGTWEKEGGGCTLNHAVHHIDMLGWMMGMPGSVVAMLTNTSHDNSEVEDLSCAIFKYETGALAQVTSSVVHHGERQQVIFQGERARVSAPWLVEAGIGMPNGFPVPNTELIERLNALYDSYPKLQYTGHTGQIDDVLSALETGSDILVKPEDGRRTIELITSIYKAGTLGETVKLPLQPSDPFYTVDGIMASVPHFYEKTKSEQELNGDITLGGKY
jgi:predicted dehydrogenase